MKDALLNKCLEMFSMWLYNFCKKKKNVNLCYFCLFQVSCDILKTKFDRAQSIDRTGKKTYHSL